MVTLDAMGCQRQVAETIVDAGGDFVLALKGNHPALHEAVLYLFTDGLSTGVAVERIDDHETLGKDHGRVERRQCWAIEDPQMVAYLDPDGRWPGLRTVVMVKSQRHTGELGKQETRYYVSSCRLMRSG